MFVIEAVVNGGLALDSNINSNTMTLKLCWITLGCTGGPMKVNMSAQNIRANYFGTNLALFVLFEISRFD